MLYVYRVTAGQEAIVADLLYKKILKLKSPVSAILVSPRLRGYVMVESNDEIAAKQLINNVPHVKGVLAKSMNVSEVKELLESKPQEIVLNKGDLIEIVSGPFKGERAKVVRLEKEDVTVELVEVAVPIPVTIKASAVKLVPQ
ncbi:MAG: transcription elongation factor Spt5 [Candidatus Micrarchaeia archaeon]|jgi:transcriptional antiterminator NusG